MNSKSKLILLTGLVWINFSYAFSVFSDDEITEYWGNPIHESDMEVDHSLWGEILNRYIETRDGLNLFSYGKVTTQDKEKLKNYLGSLQKVTVRELGTDEQMAYWINLYNALTIQVVLDHYPLDSILDISFGLLSRGPWKEKLVTVEGMALSLDNIEHQILRPIFKDNRVHYAVNCASVGCPNLQSEPFTRQNLEELLMSSAEQYVNHLRGVSVVQDRLVVSSIYDWYASDFGDFDREVIEHLIVFAEPELAQRLAAFKSISDYEYNWSLNEIIPK